MDISQVMTYLTGTLITALFLFSFMRDSNYLHEITEGKPYLYVVCLVFLLLFCAVGGAVFYIYSAFVIDFFTPEFRTLK